MAPLEPAEVVDGHHRVRLALGTPRDVDHDDRDDQLFQRDLRREPPARREVAGCVHVGSRVLAERPLLRVEAARRDRDERLPRGRVEREDGETLLEHVREVLQTLLVVPMRRGTSTGGEAGEGSGDGSADTGQDGRAAVDAGPILLLDLLANDLDSSGETHVSVLLQVAPTSLSHRFADVFEAARARARTLPKTSLESRL